ncbi:MAG: hypothetical protein HY664_00750 [Chloroflexi bacterium]|nr:hypothetical protein [Chloroflexota bacterium]
MKEFSIDQISRQIYKIGCQLVDCDEECSGVQKDKGEGILPRCLVFETDNRTDGRGSVIVGINPGRSRPVERQFYIKNGPNYEQVLAFWNKKIWNDPYYDRLRKLVHELGFGGPILWTELVKCENGERVEQLPLQTFRTCTRAHLTQELELIPQDWPLIAVGREAYKALAYLYPSRVVIGIPHAKGSHGQFSKLFDKGQLRDEFKLPFDNWWDGGNGKARWAITKDGHHGFQ